MTSSDLRKLKRSHSKHAHVCLIDSRSWGRDRTRRARTLNPLPTCRVARGPGNYLAIGAHACVRASPLPAGSTGGIASGEERLSTRSCVHLCTQGALGRTGSATPTARSTGFVVNVGGQDFQGHRRARAKDFEDRQMCGEWRSLRQPKCHSASTPTRACGGDGEGWDAGLGGFSGGPLAGPIQRII